MIDLRLLYEGFVRSYASLLLPAEEANNYPQETHAVIDYFRRVGIALGYWPWCEWQDDVDRPHDLVWLTSKNEPILHLESENQAAKLEDTLDKLAASAFPRRIGYVWLRESGLSGFVSLAKDYSQKMAESGSVTLLVARTWAGRDGDPACKRCETYLYPVRAWLVSERETEELPAAGLVWPRAGFLSMRFEGERNW